IRSKICPTPTARGAAAAALDVSWRLVIGKTIYRQCRFVVAWPIAFTLATAIDKQLANAVGADRGDGDLLASGTSHAGNIPCESHEPSLRGSQPSQGDTPANGSGFS
ncbi:MAG TPA: hypothetical protein VKG24_32685, partial [Pseudolabrys sp.]|nr:hypothetical protein [Pseudolabrys sp.]